MAPLALGLHDPRYPDRLRALRWPPSPLYVRGRLDGLEAAPARIAVVGSRRASEAGLAMAAELSARWAGAGLAVVSGGALGIDAAAHQAAVSVRGISAVVLPTSVTRPGPARNRALFEAILEAGGCWLSEIEERSLRADFAIRNRIIAALADLVVVVEAQPGSGTRHTVEAAEALGKPVAAVAWGRGQGGFVSFGALIKRGAIPLTDAEDALRAWPEAKRPVLRPTPLVPVRELAPEHLRLLEALSRADRSADALAQMLDLAPSVLLASLTALELEGLLIARPGARFGLTATGHAAVQHARCARTPTQPSTGPQPRSAL